METKEINLIFGELIVLGPDERTSDIDALLKFSHFISVKKDEKNPSNIFQKSKINSMSLSALKATSQYSEEKPKHKLNITK